MLRLIAVVALIALSGCAQPPKQKSYHVQNIKTDLATRLDVGVNYHLDADSAIIVLDISNPRADNYRYWLVQISRTDGQIVSASRRVFTGTDKIKQLIFRIPQPAEGVMEAFNVEVFNDEGRQVLKTEPINNKPQP